MKSFLPFLKSDPIDNVFPRSRLEKTFLVFLFLSQIYYAYRYPLMYNSEGTSPTYESTPTLFQAGKYALAVVFFAVSVIFVFFGRMRERFLYLGKDQKIFFHFLLAAFFYSGIVTLKIASYGFVEVEDILFVKSFFFFPLLFLFPLFYQNGTTLKSYLWIIISFGLLFHVPYSLICIFNFLFFGRLPALGNQMLARFGGGWDDPNAFGVFLTLPILSIASKGFLLGRNRNGLRYFLLIILILLMVWTVSFSSFGGFVLAFAFYLFLRGNLKVIFLVFLTILVPFLLVFFNSDLMEIIRVAYEAKQGSFSEHLETFTVWDFFLNSSFSEILFGAHSEPELFNESFYIFLLEGFGVIGFLLFVIPIILTLLKGIQKSVITQGRKNLESHFFPIGTSFLFGFCFASIAIPYFFVFPVNLFFWVIAMLIWLTPTQKEPRNAF